MQNVLSRYGLLIGAGVIIVFGVVLGIALQSPDADSVPSPEVVELTNDFESNAFTFRYPDDWQYQIPQANMMFLASPAILQQEAGASATIQRTIAMANVGETLDDKLNEVLSRGPLRPDRFWEQQGQIEQLQVGGYDAVRTTVVGSEQENTQLLQSEIVLLQAENNFVYIMTFTAPQATWDDSKPIFDAILASVDILE